MGSFHWDAHPFRLPGGSVSPIAIWEVYLLELAEGDPLDMGAAHRRAVIPSPFGYRLLSSPHARDNRRVRSLYYFRNSSGVWASIVSVEAIPRSPALRKI